MNMESKLIGGDADVAKLADIEGAMGTISHRVYNALKKAILAMEFLPGQVLRKDMIASHYGISRSPVSEAIAILAKENLVTVMPQSATRVSFLSIAEIREGCFFREALELAAVEKVAGEITDAQCVELSRNLRLQQLLVEDGDYRGFHDADNEFHVLILKYTGFAGAPGLAQLVSVQVERARLLILPTAGRASDTLAEHKKVFEAIKNRNPKKARLALHDHLGQLIKRIEPLTDAAPHLFK